MAAEASDSRRMQLASHYSPGRSLPDWLGDQRVEARYSALLPLRNWTSAMSGWSPVPNNGGGKEIRPKSPRKSRPSSPPATRKLPNRRDVPCRPTPCHADWKAMSGAPHALVMRKCPSAQSRTWNSPLYASRARLVPRFHVFARYFKVTFFPRTQLQPVQRAARPGRALIDVHEHDLDEAQLANGSGKPPPPGWARSDTRALCSFGVHLSIGGRFEYVSRSASTQWEVAANPADVVKRSIAKGRGRFG